MAIIITGIMVAAVPVVCSLVYCAPKWWGAKIAPKLPRREFREPASRRDPLPIPALIRRGGRIVATGCAWVGKALIFVAMTPVLLVAAYILACETVIKQACPYTRDKPGNDIWDALKRTFS